MRRLTGLLAVLAVGAALAVPATAGPGPAERKRVVVGSGGWLFSSQDWTVPCQDAGPVTARTADALVAAAAVLQDSGREVITLFGPDKSSVLVDALPAALPDYWCHAAQDRALWGRASSSSSFLDLRPALREESRRAQVFFRKDTHFAHAGDAVYAREVAERFDPLLPLTLGRRTSTGTVRGDLASVLGLPAHERVTSTTTVAAPVSVVELPQRDIGLKVPVRSFRATPRLGGALLPGRTVLVGDSYTAVALPQLAQLSQETVFVWTDSSAPLQPMLDELAQADRVVLQSVERLTTRFRMWRPDVVAGLRTLPRRDPVLDPLLDPVLD